MTPEEYENYISKKLITPNLLVAFNAAVTKDMDMINENLQYIIVEAEKQEILDEFKENLSATLLYVKNALPDRGIVGWPFNEIALAFVTALLLMHYKFMPGNIPELCAIHTKQFMESHDLVQDVEWVGLSKKIDQD